MILDKTPARMAGTGSVSDIDPDQARRFLHCLAPGEPVTFQTYWDPKSEKEPSGTSHARVLHGMLDQHAARLGKLNAARAGIFVAVNKTDGAGRKAENIVAVRALVLDLDGAPIEPVLAAAVTPHIVVESSPGRWHVYWKVSDCPLDRFSGLQRALAARFGGDPSVIDLPRVLRLPGFLHRKGEPVRTELRECRPDMPPYPVDVLVERLGLDEHAKQRARTGDAATAGDEDGDLLPEALTEDQWADLEDALFSFNADDRGRWISTGHALRTTDDDGRARDLWLRWSATSTAFDPDNDPERWEGFRPTRTGWRAVLAEAQRHGWRNPRSADDSAPEASEIALAAEFATRAQGCLRWSPGMDWMVNCGAHWSRDERLTRFTVAKRVAVDAAAKVEKSARAIASAKTVNGIVTLARDEHGIVTPVDAWDRNPMVLNTPAGAFDLETGQPLTTEDLYTKVAGVVPDFTMKTPVFDRFLAEIFDNDIEMVEFIQRFMGYSLTGNRREQKLFFAHGVGANGKNVLEGVLRAIAGTYSIVLPAETLIVQKNPGHPTELAQLHGVRLAVSSEVPRHARWDEARLKSLTGDSTQRARFMKKDFFEFPLTHKHLVLGNYQPRMSGGDAAMRRRMVLIPFTQQFTGTRCDPLLPTKLQAEYPGILARAITGAAKWARDGLRIPGAVSEASREYAEEQDDIGQWVAARCTEDPTAWESSGTLYESFAAWKRASGEQVPAQRAWADQMRSRYQPHRRSSARGFVGLRLDPSRCTSSSSIDDFRDLLGDDDESMADLLG